MNEYRVIWEIDINAKTPEEAAWKVADIASNVLNPASMDRVFMVKGNDGELIEVDLSKESWAE